MTIRGCSARLYDHAGLLLLPGLGRLLSVAEGKTVGQPGFGTDEECRQTDDGAARDHNLQRKCLPIDSSHVNPPSMKAENDLLNILLIARRFDCDGAQPCRNLCV